MATFTFAFYTKAQTKSGVLKKDNYGSFTGDDYESFLQGKDEAKFEAKSSISLKSYLNIVQNFATATLKESSIESAVQNSTVQQFPADADVYTHGITSTGEMKWFTRKAYPGETGFYHTTTGLYWLSFSCGNLTAFGPGPTTTGTTPAPYVGPNLKPATSVTTAGGPNSNTNFNSNVFSNDVPWNTGYGIYSQGRNDRTTDFSQDAMMFMAIQKAGSSNCNTCPTGGTTTAAATVSYAQPVMYAQPAMAATYAQPVQQASQQSGNLNVTVRNKPNALDYINTAFNGANTAFNAVNTFRGIMFENNPTVSNYTNVWPGNGGGGVTGFQGFQGSNQLGFTAPATIGGVTGFSPLGSTTIGGYSNTW